MRRGKCTLVVWEAVQDTSCHLSPSTLTSTSSTTVPRWEVVPKGATAACADFVFRNESRRRRLRRPSRFRSRSVGTVVDDSSSRQSWTMMFFPKNITKQVLYNNVNQSTNPIPVYYWRVGPNEGSHEKVVNKN
eukprot:scaffold9085_cov215-Amphora_coffeaeformis.AAC.13